MVGNDTTCFVEDKVEAVICDGCTTTTASTTSTTETTTTVNDCPLQGTDWAEWTQCSASPCEVGTKTRKRDVVKGTNIDCNKTIDFEAQVCRAECTTIPTTPATTTTTATTRPPCTLTGTDWSEWSVCSVICKDGVMNGTRVRSREEVVNCSKEMDIGVEICSGCV